MNTSAENQMDHNSNVELFPDGQVAVSDDGSKDELRDQSGRGDPSLPDECRSVTDRLSAQSSPLDPQIYVADPRQVNANISCGEYSGSSPRSRLEITKLLLSADEDTVMHAADVVPYQDRVKISMMGEFASTFRMKRINYGFTQGDVGAALGEKHGIDFSQTTVSRFESLNLSFKNMCKLHPLLVQWLADVERSLVNGDSPRNIIHPTNDSDTQVSTSTGSKACCNYPSCSVQKESSAKSSRKRRRRTSIQRAQRAALEAHFECNPRPDNETITKIGSTLSISREVVKVWFCNRRQKVRKHEM